MYPWNIIVHEDSSGKEERISICPLMPFIDMVTSLKPERLTAPNGFVVAIASNRVDVYINKDIAQQEIGNQDATTRLFDDEGNCLS